MLIGAASEVHEAGAAPGAGTFSCTDCGSQVSLEAQDEIPECPRCGSESFRRASIFETTGEAATTIEFPVAAQPSSLRTSDDVAQAEALFNESERAFSKRKSPAMTLVNRKTKPWAKKRTRSVTRRSAPIFVINDSNDGEGKVLAIFTVLDSIRQCSRLAGVVCELRPFLYRRTRWRNGSGKGKCVELFQQRAQHECEAYP